MKLQCDVTTVQLTYHTRPAGTRLAPPVSQSGGRSDDRQNYRHDNGHLFTYDFLYFFMINTFSDQADFTFF